MQINSGRSVTAKDTAGVPFKSVVASAPDIRKLNAELRTRWRGLHGLGRRGGDGGPVVEEMARVLGLGALAPIDVPGGW